MCSTYVAASSFAFTQVTRLQPAFSSTLIYKLSFKQKGDQGNPISDLNLFSPDRKCPVEVLICRFSPRIVFHSDDSHCEKEIHCVHLPVFCSLCKESGGSILGNHLVKN